MNNSELVAEKEKLIRTLSEFGYKQHQIEEALNAYGVNFDCFYLLLLFI